MPVSFDQFSDLAARHNVRDSSVVRLDSRQDLKLKQSRFRLVRWVRDSGIGKRLSNRRTVDAFISSLQDRYGREVMSRIDLRALRNLQSAGKPLPVRAIKAAIQDADIAVRTSEELHDAGRDTYLTGYGVQTAQGRQTDKLQQVFNRNTHARALQDKYGLRFDARRISGQLQNALSERLDDRLKQVLRNPEQLPGEGSVSQRVEQAIDQAAAGIVDDFVRERAAALDQLHEVRARGEISAEDMASYKEDWQDSHSLADVVMHRSIPPAMVPKLCALRSEVPDNLVDLASGAHSMEHKSQVLRRFGDALAAIQTGMSEADMEKYAADAEMKNQFSEDCRGFLLEGKLSARDASAIRQAATADGPGSNLKELCQGIVDIREEALNPSYPGDNPSTFDNERWPDFWSAAREPVGNMADAAAVLLGSDAPAPTGRYTKRHEGALQALRSTGIDIPPPDDLGAGQSGKGAFSRTALDIAQGELGDILEETKDMSKEFPGITGETAADLNRATFVFDGKTFNNQPKTEVYEAFREFCVDSNGKPDGRLLSLVSKLAYQRSNTLALLRFTSGGPDLIDRQTNEIRTNQTDRTSLLKTAPLVGMPSVQFKNSYIMNRAEDGKVVLNIRSGGPAYVMNHGTRGALGIDINRSHVDLNINLEIDTRDYSARLTGMDYDYRLVPTGRGPENPPAD